MRIAFVGPVPPLTGGIAQHSGRLVTALRARGHQVDVCSWAAQYPRALYRGEQVDPAAEPLPDARRVLRWWNPAGWWRAGRAARAADLVLVPWVVPQQALPYRVLLAGAGGTPAVAVVHNPLPHEPGRFDRLLAARFLPRLAGAVCHAEPVRNALAGLAPGVPTEVVPHPPNLTVERRPLPPGPPWRLLFLGHLRPYKGIEVAMAATAELAAAGTDVTLTVAGHPWLPEATWEQASRAAGTEDRVRLRFGYVPDAEVDTLLAEHHLVLTPYLEATQSGVVPLAHAAGRPVVTSDAGGLADAVRHGTDGIVTRAGDAADLAAGIELALDGIESLSAGTRSAVQAWDDVATAVERLADQHRGGGTTHDRLTGPGAP